MQCPVCGTINEEGFKFCYSCGTPISDSTVCPKCGTSNKSGNRFCSKCGGDLRISQSNAETFTSNPYNQSMYQQPTVNSGMYQQPTVNSGMYQQPTVNPGMYQQISVNPEMYQQTSVNSGMYQQPTVNSGMYQQPTVNSGMYQQPSVNPGMYQQPAVNPGMYQQSAANSVSLSQPDVKPVMAYNQPMIRSGSNYNEFSALGRFFTNFFICPWSWISIISFITMIVFAFGNLLVDIEEWSSLSISSFQLNDFMDELGWIFYYDDNAEWVKVFLTINNITVVTGLVCGIIQYLRFLITYNNYIPFIEKIGPGGQFLFGIGRVLTFVVGIEAFNETDKSIVLSWQFWASVVLFVIYVIADQRLVIKMDSFRAGEKLNQDEWVCVKCGRRNPGRCIRCQCGHKQY